MRLFSLRFFCLVLFLFPSCNIHAATRNVSTVAQLNAALGSAVAGDEIVLQPGSYKLDRPVNLTRPGLVLRGASGKREDVLLQGGGMNTRGVDEGILVAANDITIRDLSLEEFYFNGIHTRAEADVDRCTISNVKTINIGERHIKGSRDPNSSTKVSDDFIIERVWMLQTKPRSGHPDTNPDYIGGIDMMSMSNLVVRDCRFEGIVGSSNGGNAAIFLWQGIQNVTIERNQIIACAKGIALGNPAAPASNLPTGAWHCDGALIRNNMVLRGPWTTGNNIGLELASAKNVVCAYNTFYSARADYFRLISLSETPPGVLSNISFQYNLIRGRIYDLTTGAGWKSTANLVDGSGTMILPEWFFSPATGDFHLTLKALRALDAGRSLTNVPTDFDREKRPDGLHPDLGADEFKSADSDNDRIPDRAEAPPSAFTIGVDDAAADSDQDGASNAQEYYAGTDPLDSASVIHLLDSRVEKGIFSFDLPTTPERTFQVEAAELSDPTRWSAITNLTGTGDPVEIFAPAEGEATIYRARVSPL